MEVRREYQRVQPRAAASAEGRHASVALARANNLQEIVIGARGVEIKNLQQLVSLAELVFRSRLAPQSIVSVDQLVIAILFGRELGLSDMQSIWSVYVVQGRPAMYVDTALALAASSGLMSDAPQEYVEYDGTQPVRAVSVISRKGWKTPVKAEFTIAEAKQAGLVRPESTWVKFPASMLAARARARALRLAFPELYRGLTLADDTGDVIDDTEEQIIEEDAAAVQHSSKAAEIIAAAQKALHRATGDVQNGGGALQGEKEADEGNRLEPSRQSVLADDSPGRAAPDDTRPVASGTIFDRRVGAVSG